MKEKRPLRESRKGNSLNPGLNPMPGFFFATFAPLRENYF
jgi:hypothetical protein